MKSTISRLTFFIIMLLMLVSTSYGRDLTLNECIELALQNRSSIISARGSLDLAKANQRAALGAFLPSVRSSYSYTKGKETNIEPVDPGEVDQQDIGPNKSLNVNASWTVVDFGNFFSYFSSRASAAAAHLDVIDSEQDLIYAVKLAYYQYLAAFENVDVQTEAFARSQEQLKLIESRYELGSASKSDVLKQKVQVGNDKLSLLQANNSVVNTKANLSYTIGLDPVIEVNYIVDQNTRDYTGSLDEAIQFGLTHEPGLLSLEKSVISSQRNVKSRYMDYLPSLSLSYNFNRFKGTQAYPTTFDYSSNTKTYGFSISWNIFDGFLREYNLKSAKVTLNNSRARFAEWRNMVTRDVKSAHSEIEQQRLSQQVAEDNVNASQEDLKITQEKYNLGAATILDLLNAQVSVKQAQVSKIQADFDLKLAIAKLENAMGKM